MSEGIHRVFLMTPWGQLVSMDLDDAEISIINDLVSMTGDPFDKVVADVAKERFIAGTLK